MLLSSYELTNGTIITSLQLFYLELGLVCTKISRFVEYTSTQRFITFVQSALNVFSQGDGNPNSSDVAEIKKLLKNSWYGNQTPYCSRYSVTKYMSDKKTHAAINHKLLKRLGHLNDQLYEVELAKSRIEHNEPIFVGFFILQYAKLRRLELHYKFFGKFRDHDKYNEMETDTDSLYLILAEKV